MIRVITNLKEVVAIYGITHQNKEEEEHAQKALLIELTEIEVNSNQIYISHGSQKIARKSFRKFYIQLRLHFNNIYQNKMEQENVVILKFHEIFKNLEEIYRDLQNPFGINHPIKKELQNNLQFLDDSLAWPYIHVKYGIIKDPFI